MLSELLTAKVAAAAATVVLSATGAAAATGSLPDAVQSEVAKTVAQVGLDIDNPSEEKRAGAEERKADAKPSADDDETSGNAGNDTESDAHGVEVSSVARDKELTGRDKGEAVSVVARREHGPGTAGSTGPEAAVDTPNLGEASDDADDVAVEHRSERVGDGASDADDTPAGGAPYDADTHPKGRP